MHCICIVLSQNNTPTQHPAPNAQQHRKHTHHAQQNILTTKKYLGVLHLISVHFPPPTPAAIFVQQITQPPPPGLEVQLQDQHLQIHFRPVPHQHLISGNMSANTLFPTIPCNQQAQQSLIIVNSRISHPRLSSHLPMELLWNCIAWRENRWAWCCLVDVQVTFWKATRISFGNKLSILFKFRSDHVQTEGGITNLNSFSGITHT